MSYTYILAAFAIVAVIYAIAMSWNFLGVMFALFGLLIYYRRLVTYTVTVINAVFQPYACILPGYMTTDDTAYSCARYTSLAYALSLGIWTLVVGSFVFRFTVLWVSKAKVAQKNSGWLSVPYVSFWTADPNVLSDAEKEEIESQYSYIWKSTLGVSLLLFIPAYALILLHTWSSRQMFHAAVDEMKKFGFNDLDALSRAIQLGDRFS
jgi:hypothetical protein